MIEVGMKAPQFTLPDKNGNMVSLSDFLGKKVVLYFYTKDNTPGCTRQACAFALKNKQIENKNAVVIGISKDSVNYHLYCFRIRNFLQLKRMGFGKRKSCMGK